MYIYIYINVLCMHAYIRIYSINICVCESVYIRFVWVCNINVSWCLSCFTHELSCFRLPSCTWQHYGGFNGASKMCYPPVMSNQLALQISWIFLDLEIISPYAPGSKLLAKRAWLSHVSLTIGMFFNPTIALMTILYSIKIGAWTPARVQFLFSSSRSCVKS